VKRYLSISRLLQAVTGLMTLVLVTICAVYAMSALDSREQARRVPILVDISSDLFTAIQNFRLERGNVNTALRRPTAVDTDSQNEIAKLRVGSAKALDTALTKLRALEVDGVGPVIATIGESRDALAHQRHEVDAALQQPRDQRTGSVGTNWVAAIDDLVRGIDSLSSVLEAELSREDAFIADMIHLKQIAWSVRSDTGDDRLLLSEARVSGKRLTDEQREQFAVLTGRIDGAWKLVQDEARLKSTPPKLKAAIDAADNMYFTDFRPVRNTIVEELATGKPVEISPNDWTKLSAPGRQSIFMVSKTAFDLASTHAVEQFNAAQRNFFGAILFMILFSVIGVLTVFYVLRGVVRPITQITNTMRLVADGNLACEIPFEHRVDEIGSLSRALRVFRDNAIQTQQLYLEKIGAEAATRTKSEFLAKMSHELRTPLNAIIGFSEMIQKAIIGPLSERYREYGTDIFNSGTHLLELINEILDLSKLEAGQFELHEEDIDLGDAIEASMRLVGPQAEKSKVHLSKAIDENLVLIRADNRRMRQVLINLLSNAVKFTPEGGNVRVSSFRTNVGLAIAISDTGIGMASEEIPKAMEEFGQIDSKISRQHAGTGLGLPLAKHLIELHGGTLTIKSEVNVGTTVTIVLPHERIVARSATPQIVKMTA
jgi:signal transduction histidine kinase